MKEELPFSDEGGDERRLALEKETGVSIRLLRTGVGKVNAASAVTEALVREPANAVIVVGTAGALSQRAHKNWCVVITRANQHDVDVRALTHLQLKRGDIPFEKTSTWIADASLRNALFVAVLNRDGAGRQGGIISGDRFLADAQEAERLEELFFADVVDMETAAVAQACLRLNTVWASFRVVSDAANGQAPADFVAAVANVAQRIEGIVAEGMRNWGKI